RLARVGGRVAERLVPVGVAGEPGQVGGDALVAVIQPGVDDHAGAVRELGDFRAVAVPAEQAGSGRVGEHQVEGVVTGQVGVGQLAGGDGAQRQVAAGDPDGVGRGRAAAVQQGGGAAGRLVDREPGAARLEVASADD